MVPVCFNDLCCIFPKKLWGVENDPTVFRGPIRLNSNNCLTKIYYDTIGFHSTKCCLKIVFDIIMHSKHPVDALGSKRPHGVWRVCKNKSDNLTTFILKAVESCPWLHGKLRGRQKRMIHSDSFSNVL